MNTATGIYHSIISSDIFDFTNFNENETNAK